MCICTREVFSKRLLNIYREEFLKNYLEADKGTRAHIISNRRFFNWNFSLLSKKRLTVIKYLKRKMMHFSDFVIHLSPLSVFSVAHSESLSSIMRRVQSACPQTIHYPFKFVHLELKEKVLHRVVYWINALLKMHFIFDLLLVSLDYWLTPLLLFEISLICQPM